MVPVSGKNRRAYFLGKNHCWCKYWELPNSGTYQISKWYWYRGYFRYQNGTGIGEGVILGANAGNYLNRGHFRYQNGTGIRGNSDIKLVPVSGGGGGGWGGLSVSGGGGKERKSVSFIEA